MRFSLGIDAGGTYTDSVIVSNSDEEIIASSKALTTYPDPLDGIRNSLDGLDPDILKKVNVVSVSTTLSTNSILEGTGFPVGLILVGEYDIQQDLPTQHYVQVSGGHNHNGIERDPLDEESVKGFVVGVKDKVSAFAVSSLFSVRNPDHEMRIKEIIREHTGLPAVCAYELSQDLGAFERAVTAFLNAQLIPVTDKFMQTVESEVHARGMDAKVFMLKCDGSVIGIKKALEKPIESIFSGPAGSLVGASFLTSNDTCAVIDVGGTSTDISVINEGVPEMSDSGAVVGGWKTRVKAIKMETSAMGGDSHVWVKQKKVHIGPRRVIPLCRAAVMYPGFTDHLKRNPVPSKIRVGVNYQPTRFYLRTLQTSLDISEEENEILDAIDDEPTSIEEIKNRINKYPSPKVIDLLIQKRLVQAIGFTPTDALHVLGDYTHRDEEAASVGADKLAAMAGMDDKYEFANYIKKEFAKNMASDLVSFFLEGINKEEVRKIFDIECPTKFKVDVPVVLIGGPVAAFEEELKKIIDAEVIVPEHSRVGNAAGALAAKGIRRFEVLIRPASMAAPDFEFLVFSEKGRESFYDYHEALDHAITLGETTVLEYMREAGLDSNHIKIDVNKEEIIPDGWKTPMETKLVVLGVGTRMEGE